MDQLSDKLVLANISQPAADGRRQQLLLSVDVERELNPRLTVWPPCFLRTTARASDAAKLQQRSSTVQLVSLSPSKSAQLIILVTLISAVMWKVIFDVMWFNNIIVVSTKDNLYLSMFCWLLLIFNAGMAVGQNSGKKILMDANSNNKLELQLPSDKLPI